ncbi:hypothetical protein QOZ80_4BG0338540 [Eleusine coracana subsp. coracana]|nr:hypothetical protein QOZ80_4BG0338540 [Eleusine coracana subsp. coracana]
MDTFTSLLCCLGTRRRQMRQQQQRPDGRGGKDHAKTNCLRATRRRVAARFTRSARADHLDTPGPQHRRRRWPRLRGMNQVFAGSSPSRDMTAAGTGEPRPSINATTTATVQEEEEVIGDRAAGGGHGFSSRENAAAATIQAHFRGHLARQAFRALRSLVKLQAFARGSYVRKQANVAIRFMKLLVRIQVRVRARQLLSTRPKNDR